MQLMHCFVNFLGAESFVFLLTCVPAFATRFFLLQRKRAQTCRSIRAKTTVCFSLLLNHVIATALSLRGKESLLFVEMLRQAQHDNSNTNCFDARFARALIYFKQVLKILLYENHSIRFRLLISEIL